MILVVFVSKMKRSFVTVHIGFFVLFMQGLHLARLFGSEVNSYDYGFYVATNVVVFLYLVLLVIGLVVVKRYVLTDQELVDLAVRISNKWLVLAPLSWIAFKAYLVTKYGASAFVILRQASGDEVSFQYAAWWEMPVETYIGVFAIGASVAYAIKCISIRGYWKKLLIAIPFILFFTAYLFLHEAGVGPRRFVVLLAMIVLVAMAHRARKSPVDYLCQRWKSVLVILIVVFSFSFYYQAIRSNFHDPEIMENLLTNNPLKFAAGVRKFFQPSAEISSTTKFLRDGPFNILYRVIEARGEGSSGTEGEIIKESMLGVIPRILLGQKKRFVHADELFESRMSITPKGPYLKSDIATNILAIFIADFGFLLLFVPPFIILGGLVFATFLIRNRQLSWGPFSLFWISMMFVFASMVETDFGSVLVTLRNAMFVIMVIILADLGIMGLRQFKTKRSNGSDFLSSHPNDMP